MLEGACLRTPQDRHEGAAASDERLYSSFCDGLPAASIVGLRPAGLNSQHPVEEQDAPVRPRPQVAVRWPWYPNVVHQFPVYVIQRGRQGVYVWLHRERQTHGMPGRGVRVLANDEQPYAVERAHKCTQAVLG